MPQDPLPKKTRLSRILKEHPEARDRLRRTVGGLLWVVLASVVAIALLGVWHLRRRADLIRSRLGEARGGSLPEFSKERPPPDEERPA